MFRPHKLILISLTILMIVALSACTLGQAAEPTPTTVDVTAVFLAAAQTAQVQLTLVAAAQPTITDTLQPSETPTQTTTATPGGAIELTSTQTLALTPSETPFGTTAIPSFTPIGPAPVTGPTSASLCKNAAYDGDITVPDGTVFSPWEKFQKVWSVRNTGTCRWDEGFYFGAISGPPSMGKNQGVYRFRSAKDFIEPGAAVNIAIDMYAPGDPGEYVAHWHMFDDQGQPFGGDFTVVIKVVK